MKWLKIILFKIKFFVWKVMSKKYQFEETTLDPVSASDVLTVINGKFRVKEIDDFGRPISYEEIVQIVFPNGAVEDIPASEENLKYAAALKRDKANQPKV